MKTGIGRRIEHVISKMGLKKVEFASRLKIDQSYVTQLTSERRNPSDRLISDICREFNVNETWLRTGEGEMFIEKTRTEEIDQFISEIMQGEPDFRRRLVSVLARMTPEEWELLERKALELVAEMKNASPATTEDAEEVYRSSLGFAPIEESSALNTTAGTKENVG